MKNLTHFFHCTANTPQNTGGGNSHFFMRLCKSTALLLMVLTLCVGNAWGDTETILEFTVSNSVSTTSVSASGTLALNTTSHLASLTGGSISLKNTNTSSCQFP